METADQSCKRNGSAKPKTVEYKQSIGTLSIGIEFEHTDGRRSYVLSFFFEHLQTCATYCRIIRKNELQSLFPILQTQPGLAHKYIENAPIIRECPNMVVAIFENPDNLGPKLYISIPAYPRARTT